MGFLARRIRDDRGVVRELYGTGYGIGARTEAHALSDVEYHRIHDRADRARDRLVDDPRYVGAGPRVFGVIVLFAAVWITCAFVVFRLAPWLGMHPPLAFPTSCALVSVLALLLSWRSFVRIRFPVAIADAMLAEKRCPACGYNLGRAGAEADSCVVCAECGGAWKLPRWPCTWCGHELAGAKVMKDGLVYCASCARSQRPEV